MRKPTIKNLEIMDRCKKILEKTDLKTVYFQPPGIDEKYCEVGMFLEEDPEYIYYSEEPCKIKRSEVKIIDKENVFFNKKTRIYKLRNNE